MGFIRSVIRCFCCDFEDEDQPSEPVPILFPTSHDAPENGCPLSQRLLSSSPSSESYTLVNNSGIVQVKKKEACLLEELHSQVSVEKNQDAYLLEELHFEEPKEKNQGGCLLELLSEGPIEKKQDACLLEKLHFEEPIAKKHNACLLVELHFEEPIEKKQDLCLLEELHSEEPIEKNQDVCLLENLHSEEPIEDVEQKEQEVIKGVVAEERWINHYSSFQKILLVGEGDFSFSACLANAFGSASNMIATSHDSREFLRENYRRAMTNIENLTSKGCSVIHGVDTKKMANNPLLKGMTFDRIIFNFPFAGFFKTETCETQLRRHRRIVSLFLKNAKEMINETGEIHITHKTNAFHCEWNIEHLASCHGLRLVEAARFHHRNYPGYMTKCGFGGDNYFNCNPSKTYKFGLRQKTEAKKVLWIARSNLELQ